MEFPELWSLERIPVCLQHPPPASPLFPQPRERQTPASESVTFP